MPSFTDPSHRVRPRNAEERERIIEVARWFLGEQIEGFLAGYPVHVIHAGGDLPPAARRGRDYDWYEARPKFLAIYLATDEENASAERWHGYLEENAYPELDYGRGREDRAPAGYPPLPLSRTSGVHIGLTWNAIRRELLGEREPKQLSLGVAA